MERSESAPRRGRLIAAGVAATALVAAGVVVYTMRGTSADQDAGEPQVQTVAVTKMDLSDNRTLGGELGFGTPVTVKGSGDGLVTKLPAVGDKAVRGKPLYWVNDQPVPVLFGDTPLYRPLNTTGLHGSDVKVLLDNLKALGYPTGVQPAPSARNGAPPAATLTWSLLVALKKWQKDVGLAVTGTLEPGQVAVLPGPGRVGTLTAHPGDAAAGDLLTVTASTKVITVAVGATEVGAIAVGAKVKVTLPTAAEIPATVTAVSHVVVDSANSGGNSAPKVDVTVTPDKVADVAALDAASVQVAFTTTTHAGVLAVPVGALLALREGGYAVQRSDGALIAVETGMFAKGMVEVSGNGLAEGLEVVTTS
ncbi:hypothetical protein [Catellatospora citrea]|uniref:Peptidoglycan-binding protein n=1 Tax=Catellatospora citrea TaxID=53366 RepID=A0A8J3KL18_9ACTN|nr:hypothetical protein [Catellatospora citrea]RKE10629.1 hypothetical protein C8E86_5545 [Catellatospora citrea]GIG02915.1 peptidoglycan-binding protein [Catellatospora citrea]